MSKSSGLALSPLRCSKAGSGFTTQRSLGCSRRIRMLFHITASKHTHAKKNRLSTIYSCLFLIPAQENLSSLSTFTWRPQSQQNNSLWLQHHHPSSLPTRGHCCSRQQYFSHYNCPDLNKHFSAISPMKADGSNTSRCTLVTFTYPFIMAMLRQQFQVGAWKETEPSFIAPIKKSRRVLT